MDPSRLALASRQAYPRRLPRSGGAYACRAAIADLSAAGVRGRGAQAEGGSGAGGGREGVSAPGRRLRRELQGIPPRQHPRHLPHSDGDERGADLRGFAAGGEGGPDCGPVRQAALGADRDARRRDAALLSRRQYQRHGVHAGITAARSGTADKGLFAIGGDTEPDPRVRERRLRRSAQRASLDGGLRGR